MCCARVTTLWLPLTQGDVGCWPGDSLSSDGGRYRLCASVFCWAELSKVEPHAHTDTHRGERKEAVLNIALEVTSGAFSENQWEEKLTGLQTYSKCVRKAAGAHFYCIVQQTGQMCKVFYL